MSTAPRPEGPFSQSVDRLRTEFDRWVEAALSQGERAIDAMGLRTGRPWMPAVDVVDDPDTVRVLINLPGVDSSAIDLTLTGHMLTVSGALPSLDLGAQGERILGERPVGEFRRTIPLPASVDAEKISASSRHGVLTVTIPKNEQQKARKIPVHSAPGPQV